MKRFLLFYSPLLLSTDHGEAESPRRARRFAIRLANLHPFGRLITARMPARPAGLNTLGGRPSTPSGPEHRLLPRGQGAMPRWAGRRGVMSEHEGPR